MYYVLQILLAAVLAPVSRDSTAASSDLFAPGVHNDRTEITTCTRTGNPLV